MTSVTPRSPAPESTVRKFALIGNPNSGKTSLFNALTGLRQKVGNYPGVTVERKEGTAYTQHGKPLTVIDLPGSYSLQPRSPDERVLVDVLLGRLPGEARPDAVICTVDASNLERNLFLVTQALELGLPLIIALNMMDVVRRRGIRIDTEKLSKALGVPVIPIEANRGKGMIELRLAMSRADLPRSKGPVKLPELLREASKDLGPLFKRPQGTTALSEAEAHLFLSADESNDVFDSVAGPALTRIRLWRQRLDREIPGWRSEVITKRYAFIGDLLRDAVQRFNPNKPSRTERVDRILLSPVWGILSLMAVMAVLFYSIFSFAVPFMDAIDAGIGWLAEQASAILPDGDLEGLVVDGVIGGVGGVIIFLPQILMLFFFISMLESTGYMARAAFILDRIMSKVGLHGRSFVPLLSSYACAVPGIMATRTIESFKDRLVTILVAPFMTCSARLPVYLVLIAALLPQGEHSAAKSAGLLFALYFLGTFAALGFGLIFKKTLLKGATPTMVMELPPYRLPQMRWVLLELWDRGRVFLRRAGTIIFGLSIVLWFLMNFPKTGLEQTDAPPALAEEVGIAITTQEGTEVADLTAHEEAEEASALLAGSFAGRAGRAVEPIFAPLGYDWKINVGIIASFAAREIFVSTMAIVYSVEDADDTGTLVDVLHAQKRPDGTPVFSVLTCLSLMVFFAFALQCLSTVAVVKRETNSWRWPLFQIAFMFAFAWFAAMLVYQGGRLLGFS
jgi:ferrous iron transport protein B